MENKQEEEFFGRGTLWQTDPTHERTITFGSSGPAASTPETVIQRFNSTINKFPKKIALSQKRDGAWVNWTWEEYGSLARKAAKALLHIGVNRAQGVSIIGFNSPEYLIADMAIIMTGGIVAPIYTTNNAEACRYIADHCKCSVVFTENEMQTKKFLSLVQSNSLPNLKKIVQWGGKLPENETMVMSWDDFLNLSLQTDDEELNKRISELKPSKCATLIYTSGTTGPPKAVMASHDNLTWTANAVCNDLGINENDHFVSYLPLSHVAAQMVDIYATMTAGAQVWFANPDALKGSLLETLKDVQPTVFLGVPRVWEKIAERMQEIGKSTTGYKKMIVDWAKGIALQGNKNIQEDKPTPWGFWATDKVLFSKIRAALGLNRARLAGSAAAPISKDILEYFLSLNLPIFEIYGMSECSGPQTVSKPGKYKTGSTGTTFPGATMKIENPDKDGNGEICYKGRHVFMGYMYNDKATVESIDKDGYLHSGDIGKIDENGYLYITGRIKELIITAGGENVPPVLIEEEIMKEIGQVISNVMVIGDKRKFLTAVVTLKCGPNSSAKPGEYPFTNQLAPNAKSILSEFAGTELNTVEDAMKNAKVTEYITQGITKANKKATSNAQVVQKFVIIPKDFTLEGGELTPTMKLKRRIVVDAYAKEIEGMYAGAQ